MFARELPKQNAYQQIAEIICKGLALPVESSKEKPLGVLVDGYLELELQELRGHIFLVGVVLSEALLVGKGDDALNALLTAAGERMGTSEATLAWEAQEKRVVLWKELSVSLNEEEILQETSRFLKELDAWIGIAPAPA